VSLPSKNKKLGLNEFYIVTKDFFNKIDVKKKRFCSIENVDGLTDFPLRGRIEKPLKSSWVTRRVIHQLFNGFPTLKSDRPQFLNR